MTVLHSVLAKSLCLNEANLFSWTLSLEEVDSGPSSAPALPSRGPLAENKALIPASEGFSSVMLNRGNSPHPTGIEGDEMR